MNQTGPTPLPLTHPEGAFMQQPAPATVSGAPPQGDQPLIADPVEALFKDAEFYDRRAAEGEARIAEIQQQVRVFRDRAAAYRRFAKREQREQRERLGDPAAALQPGLPDPAATGPAPAPGTESLNGVAP